MVMRIVIVAGLAFCAMSCQRPPDSKAEGAKATLTAVSSKTCFVWIASVDGDFEELHQQASLTPGRHLIRFRVADPRGVVPSADAPLDTTFEAGHRYIFQAEFSPTGDFIDLMSGLRDLDSKDQPKK